MPIDIDKITAYENDELSHEEEVEFIQSLIDSGGAWKLQGHYGRTAEYFISEGWCSLPDQNISL